MTQDCLCKIRDVKWNIGNLKSTIMPYRVQNKSMCFSTIYYFINLTWTSFVREIVTVDFILLVNKILILTVPKKNGLLLQKLRYLLKVTKSPDGRVD